MNCSVVLVTYNRIALLKECLACILKQSLIPFEIIVVDNCSTDGTKEYLDELDDGRFRVFHMERNLGGAGGFAFGLSKISPRSDYTLLIDDDAMISGDYLERIDMARSPGILAYSGTVRTGGKTDTSHRRRISNHVLMTKKDVPEEEYAHNFFDYDLSTFCGLLVSSGLIRKIGLPKAEYFIWYDDTEYSLRIGQYTKIRNVNSAVLDHKTKLQAVQGLSWKSYYGYRNQWDVGLTYSAYPIIYNLFREAFHRFRQIEFSLKYLKTKDPYDKWASELHKDVLGFPKSRELGVCKKYLP